MIERKKIWVPEKRVVTLATDQFDDTITHPNEVVVKNLYSHISAGTELACLDGLESFFQIPNTPGYTAVAEIQKVGDAVEGYEPGDIVYTYGPHAEYHKFDITCRWSGVCVKLPKGINPEFAAFTHMAGIAMTSIRTSKIELGDYVLITGLGAIGNLAAQLAQLQGANVIATDINEERIELAKKCGIKAAINTSKTNLKEFIEEFTNGDMISTYIDASGSSLVIEATVDCVALNGETILLGSPRAEYQTNLTGFLQHHHNLPWCKTLKGALEFTYPTQQNDFSKHSIERNAKIIMDLIKSGDLKVKPLYSHKIRPTDGQSAYDGLRSNPDDYTGVIIDWTR